MKPETRYAKASDGVHIAYQVVGEGPIDLVFVMGWTTNIEAMWDEPRLARFLSRLASFSRLVLFDKRGVGLSDRVSESELPTFETRMDDIRAVMDTAGSERAMVFGVSEGGPLATLFTATYPDRAIGLVLFGTSARYAWAPDFPWGATFDGPIGAVRCALAASEAVGDLGLQIRAGLHTGEVELDGGGVRGIAVHIGARVAGMAGPSEVLVSSTVKDLVAGSALEFEDRGEHTLKGVPGDWRLYRVVA